MPSESGNKLLIRQTIETPPTNHTARPALQTLEHVRASKSDDTRHDSTRSLSILKVTTNCQPSSSQTSKRKPLKFNWNNCIYISLLVDWLKMDHSHMDHGGMAMPAAMCNMNVSLHSSLPSLPFPSLPIKSFHSNASYLFREEYRREWLTMAFCETDALHLEHQQPLHHLPLVAHPNHARPNLLFALSRSIDRCLRSPTIR